ncbi:MAG: protein kinase, partial [Chloroflexota bacterium]
MSSLVGRTLGQYEIIDVLGRGGMATVYLGKQSSIDRTVAIKVLPPHPALDEAFKERFQLEAKTIGGLQNPNILPLYDYGTFEDVIYLVMAHVEGGTLEDLMDNGAMSTRDVERVLRPVSSALDYAHSRGVIHRDVKPANILMQDGHPLLADFGMVKMVAAESNLTGTAIVGTPTYMAPEQGQGLIVDKRVDVYALAAILYEMLTGSRVYAGDTPMQLILAHINNPIPDIRDLRPDLDENVSAVLTKGLAKEPNQRYSSAGELAEAFSRAIHSNDDSLAQAQQSMPIKSKLDTQVGKKPAETATLNDTVTKVLQGTGGGNDGTPPSTQIIVRDSTNPIVLMGGFGLIALVIVIVAVLLINNNGNDTVTPPDLPNVADATSDPIDDDTETVAEPPTVAPTPLPTAIPAPVVATFGEVRFSTAASLGDRIVINMNDAAPAPNGLQYAGWLINDATDETLILGQIVVEAFGDGIFDYTDPDGRMLPALFNRLIITTEESIGDAPTGEVVYEASVPVEVSSALSEIFVASENGINGNSLLEGARTEARNAVRHAGLAAGSTNIGGASLHAEHTIQILRGDEDDYNGDGSTNNPGAGIG